jgi:hypothetical protein
MAITLDLQGAEELRIAACRLRGGQLAAVYRVCSTEVC